jgi:hypothetical protein
MSFLHLKMHRKSADAAGSLRPTRTIDPPSKPRSVRGQHVSVSHGGGSGVLRAAACNGR